MIHSKSIRIKVADLNFSRAGSVKKALDSITFTVYDNEYICIMGANGSGKSTLLSCINGMELSSAGSCFVFDTDGAACDCGTEDGLARARRVCGTVMQNPEDQIIGSIVEDDVAFSPENEGAGEAETERRVSYALEAAGLTGLRGRNVETLSGGQKQRLALAGLLASQAEILLLDEPDSMLDPAAKSGLDALVYSLWQTGKTILRVTHNVNDARAAPRCFVLEGGRLIYDGPTAAYLEKVAASAGDASSQQIPGSQIEPPVRQPAPAADALFAADAPFAADCPRAADCLPAPFSGSPSDAALTFLNVSYAYKNTAGGNLPALNGVAFSLPRGISLAIMGHTGSGKSTALKLANALMAPDSGEVHTLGADTQNPKIDLRALRFRAALAVQNPENALFETYVCDDVAFGPRNKGLRGDALVCAVREAMEAAGLPFDEYAARPTYALSGGEKRLAALAGLLAMDAELYLLDEPAAGLDGKNTRRILDLLDNLKAQGKTVAAATHSVDFANRQDFVISMNAGRIQRGPEQAAAVGGMAEQAAAVGGTAEQAAAGKGGKKAKRTTGLEFFNTADAGGFLGIPSALCRMSAAKKIGIFSAAAAAVFAGKSLVLPAAAAILTLVCAGLAGRIRAAYMLRGLRPLLPFFVILTAAQFAFNFQTGSSPVIFRIGTAVLTKAELIATVRTAIRFAAIISILRLYSAVTSLRDSLAALKKLLQPLGKIGLPINDLALAATVTARFIPILRAEARSIVEAQASRGARLSGFGRLRCLISLILPLFIRALDRAQTLAAAITMRGYR